MCVHTFKTHNNYRLHCRPKLACLHKKLCSCRGSRDAPQTPKVALERLAIGGMTFKDTQGHHHHNCCFYIGRIQVSLPVCAVLLQQFYLALFPRYYYFCCVRELPVTLRSPSTLTIKFKSQAVWAFRFMFKHTVVKTQYISWVRVLQRFNTPKVTFELTQWATVAVIPFNTSYMISH